MTSLGAIETPFDVDMGVIERFYFANGTSEDELVTTSLCLVQRPGILMEIANRLFRNTAWQSQFDPAVSAERFREALQNVTSRLDPGRKTDSFLLNQVERATEAFNSSNKKTIEELRSWGIPTPDEHEVVVNFDEERHRAKPGGEQDRWCWDALLGAMPASTNGSELDSGDQSVIPATPPTSHTSSSPKVPSSHSSPETEESKCDEAAHAERGKSLSPRVSSPERPQVVSSLNQPIAKGSEQERASGQHRDRIGRLRRLQSFPPLTMILRERSPKEITVEANNDS